MINNSFVYITYYTPNTGEVITQQLTTMEKYNELKQNHTPVVLGKGHIFSHYVKNGELTAYLPIEKQKKLSKEELVDFWDNSLMDWDLIKATPYKWQEIRDRRNYELEKSDWTQLPDVPIPTKTAWATYRQELRDVTTQTDPFNITWPVPPNA